MTRIALLLAPSRGLGGGIERYVETVEWALEAEGVRCHRINLRRPGVSGHVGMVAEGRAHLQASSDRARVIAAHRSLLPAAAALAQSGRVDGISVICHGNDVWGSRRLVRGGIECFLMRQPAVRIVAVSSFTAGAVSRISPASVLPPGLSRDWYQALVDASVATPRLRPRGADVQIATAFRLIQWRDKGLSELLRAVASLGRQDVRVSVCGSGTVPDGLQRLLGEHPECTVKPGLSDRELAREFASADLFVLATRMRRGKHPSGEGFGLVLLEAQVAGTPVVGPAYAGSHDAYLDGVTGVTPADESAESLARAVDMLLRDRWRLEQMGKDAAEWARGCFTPELYASRAVARLL